MKMPTKTWTKQLLYLLSILMLFSGVLPLSLQTVDAEGDSIVWTEISTESQLVNIKNDLSGNYRLTADIDLSGNWTPIGSSDIPFTGRLDGNGKVVRNLSSVSVAAYQGMFSVIGANGIVSNLGIESASITTSNKTYQAAGILAGVNHGEIDSCFAKGTITGDVNVGGLVGINTVTGGVYDSYARATVNGNDAVGGLIGYNSGTVSTSYAASTVPIKPYYSYFNFDQSVGQAAYISVNHSVYYPEDSFTIEAWVKWDDVGSPKDDVQFIIGKGMEQFEIHTEGGSGVDGIRFIPVPNGLINHSAFGFQPSVNTSAYAYVDAKSAIHPDWFHIATVYDRGQQTGSVYINGVAQSVYQNINVSVDEAAYLPLKDPISHPFAANTSPITIGRRADGSMYFDGKIADIRLWKTPRNGQQIIDNMNTNLAGNEENLVGYWRSKSASGAFVEDSSTHDNIGTMIGDVTAETCFGGLVGFNIGVINNCYYDSSLFSQTHMQSGTGLITTQMKDASNLASNYVSWDFSNVWAISGTSGSSGTVNEGYPYHRYRLNYSSDSNGSLNGSTVQHVVYGGTGSPVQAVTGDVYRFSGWSDGLTSNPRTDANIYSNISVTAEYLPKMDITGITFNDLSTTYDGLAETLSISGTLPAGASVSYTNNTGTNPGTYDATASIEGGADYNDLILHATLTIMHRDPEPTVELEPAENTSGDELPGAISSGTAVVSNQQTSIGGSLEAAVMVKSESNDGIIVSSFILDVKELAGEGSTSGEKPLITIPIHRDADKIMGQLSGTSLNELGLKEASIQIQTRQVTYTLLVAQIDIVGVSELLGGQVALEDIQFNISIANAHESTMSIVEDTADKNNYQVVVKPVDFEITCTSGIKTIEVTKFNGYVERSVTIPDGVDIGKITTGVVLNSDGSFSHVPTTIVMNDGKYYARINSLTNSTYSVIYSPKTFKDVETHWARDAVNDMGSRLVIDGSGKDGDGNINFSPDSQITRTEFSAIIVRALGLREGLGAESFSDEETDDSFIGFVKTAVEYGLIKGYDDGTFKPDAQITREEAMTIIARAMKWTGLKTEFEADELATLYSVMADTESVAMWAEDAVGTCLKNGIVTGRDGLTIAPKAPVTRAEAAVMAQRLLKKSKLIN